jgi:inosine/xanthosine triphosphatase
MFKNMSKEVIKILVGSLNPVKINAVKNAFSNIFANNQIICKGTHAPSGVSEQPMTASETRLGAINRALFCKNGSNNADFYVALEGGVDLTEDGPITCAYFSIINNQQQSVGRSASLPLPQCVYESLKSGEELGNVMDDLFKTTNIKQKGGAIGLLTHNNATRESIYTQALILALSPFINADLYHGTGVSNEL